MDAAEGGAPRDARWLSEAIGRPVRTPEQLYAEQRAASLDRAAAELGIARGIDTEPRSPAALSRPAR
jgi:hypothetical protein